MKTMQAIISLGLTLILIGCQGLTSDNVRTQSTAPLYTYMTDSDVEQANRALQHSLENLLSTQKHSWTNSSSGNSGAIIPLRTFKSIAGYYCRDYREVININTRQQVYVDTACRGTDGNWYPI